MKSGLNMKNNIFEFKDIDRVIENQLDLIKVRTKLLPVAVIKG